MKAYAYDHLKRTPIDYAQASDDDDLIACFEKHTRKTVCTKKNMAIVGISAVVIRLFFAGYI